MKTKPKVKVKTIDGSKNHKVVPHNQWLKARKAFLAREKNFSKLRDELARQRRELPWEVVEKDYTFAGPKGKESLAELFGDASQLIAWR